MILLDTNTLIYYIRGIESVVARFQATPRRELRIPSIVAYGDRLRRAQDWPLPPAEGDR